jgi:putative ABC transport system permease protein
METILKELGYALRQLRKSLGFSISAVLMLALGIGATTATFSVVEGVLLRPLPFPDSGRLVALSDTLERVEVGPGGEAGVTAPEIRTYVRDTNTFENLGGYQPGAYEFSGTDQPSPINGARLTPGVFAALGVQPLLGRVFTQQEDDDSQQVVVLSYSLWKSRFHGDSHILGAKLILDRKSYLVIGVMPRNFEFPLMPGHLSRSELWVPMSPTQAELTQGAGSWAFQMVGRLKPGITVARAQANADQVAQEITRNLPSFISSVRIRAMVLSLQEDTVSDARPLVRILFVAVCVVLLIVCANLAGLLLVRAIRRRREIAVRLALGASASALLRAAFLESMLLSMSGSLLGVALAAIALHVSINQLPETLPRIDEIGLNWTVIGFALLLALATGMICALAPAFAAMRTNLNDTLKEGGRSGSGGGHARLRSTLVVAEIAVALVLLITSGLLLRSFEKMRTVAPGFRSENVVFAAYALPRKQYSSQAEADEFGRELLRRLEQLPSVQSAALGSFLPMSGSGGTSVFIPEGYQLPQDANMSVATISVTRGDYFRTMGIPLLRGRFLTDADNGSAPLVVVVNHKLAQRYWPGQDPIGKRLRLGTPEMKTPWLTIVGEIADVKQNGPDVEAGEQYYEPVDQYEASLGSIAAPTDIIGNSLDIFLRSQMPPEQMENAMRSVVRSLDPQLPLAQVQTMNQAISDSEAPRRFNTAVISAFAGMAVLLAVLGIYSVVAFSVVQRVQEIAIRMALGSQRAGVVRLIVNSAGRLAIAGCIIGLLGAAAVSRIVNSLLFNVSPFDPFVLTFAAIAIFLLALAASAIPALRAASIDPMRALRTE